MIIHEKLRQRLAARSSPTSTVRQALQVRPSADALERGVQMVSCAPQAEQMAFQLTHLPVSFVGLHIEFRHGPPFDEAGLDAAWQDVSRLQPIALGIAAFVSDDDRNRVIRYCVDVRSKETLAALERVLRQPFRFIVHNLQSAYMALQAFGLLWPAASFDTWLAAHLLNLGRHHARYALEAPEDDAEAAEIHEHAKVRRQSAASLLSLTQQHGVVYPFDGDKAAMRQRYASLRHDEPLTRKDGEYVTADAFSSAELYTRLQPKLMDAGLDWHYYHLELPAAIHFADMEWHGVPVDTHRIAKARDAVAAALLAYESKLAPFGFRIEKKTPAQVAAGGRLSRVMTTSYNERLAVFKQLGLLHLFESPRAKRRYSFKKEALKQHRDTHPVINLLYLHDKYTSIIKDKLFAGRYVGADGRVHPYIHPLGADSGRVTTRRPNLLGIGRILRPIVVPDRQHYALVELDFTQQEIFIAAAIFGDDLLLADCNAGDVYCQMVRTFSSGELRPGDELLCDEDLATTYPELRGRWKVITLAIIYGMSDESVAASAKLRSVAAARALRQQFFGRYDKLRDGIVRAITQLQARGFTSTVTGLRRYRARTGPLSPWEKRWAVNAPVQGGGACVLKLALPRVARFLHPHGGRVVLAIHDALLLLIPSQSKQTIIDGATELMKSAFVELYPGTQPRVDVNSEEPSCWNYKGFANSIERFVANPEFNCNK